MSAVTAFRPYKPRELDTPKGAVSALFDQVGGPKTVKALLKVEKSRVYAFADPDTDDEISFDRVWMLTSPTATAAAELLAFKSGCVLHPVPANGDNDQVDLMDVADQAKDHGAAIAAILHAAADGEITAKEREQALPHIDATIRGLVRLRACMIAAADQV